MTDAARAERLALADLLDRVGPDAPTLCAGWTTRDLAAHLVLRESRPDAAVGIVASPLSGWTASVQSRVARRDFTDLVEAVRSGPPWWSWMRLPRVDSVVNLVEFTVHHEDVRRGRPGWSERELDPERAELLWGRLQRLAGLAYRRVPVGVVLDRTDGAGGQLRARPGEPAVTLRGPALELLLRTYGRTEVTLATEGDPLAVAALGRARLGL